MSKSTQLILSLLIITMALLLSCTNSTDAKKSVKPDTMETSTVEKRNDVTTIKGHAGNIHFVDVGRNGLPVIFLHSFGGSVKHWDHQLKYLESKRRVITIDFRGHGQSDLPSDNDYNVSSLAGDIAAVVDSLQLRQFILAGHSMGGSAAIAYAGNYPGHVAGLVLMGTPGKTPAEQSKPIITSLESEKYDTVMNEYMKKLLMNAKPETNRLETEGMKKISKESSVSLIKALFNYDPIPDLRKYGGPKLIVSHAGDEQPNSLHNAFPDIPYKTVEGTSHWIQLDKPEEFNRILDEFLSHVEKQKAHQ